MQRGRKMYTHTRKKKKNKLYNNWVHEYCIDCAFHTPNPEGGQGQGPCSVKQWDGKRQKRNVDKVKRATYPPTGMREEKEKSGGLMCVLTFCRHSEKTGSSFQTPVQAIEWVSSVKESDTELSRVCFKYSIVRKSPHLLLSYLISPFDWGQVGSRWWTGRGNTT